MTKEQKRGALLANRLEIINNYLLEMAECKTPFSQYLAERKISKKMFTTGLPTDLQNPPTEYNKVMAYGILMNDIYSKQYMLHCENKGIPADGLSWDNRHPALLQNSEVEGLFDANHYTSADGQDEINEDVVEDGSVEANSYNAVGDCGLPPIPPVRSRSNKKAKAKWAEYDKKKAAYDACRNKKKDAKAAKKPEGAKKGLHIANKLNPIFVASRTAFRSLIAINMFNWGYKFNQMRNSNSPYWKKLQQKWYNIGGDVGDLIASINSGKSKKPIFKGKHSADGVETFNAFGIDDATIAAWIATATPIVAFVTPIVKDFKKSRGESGNPDETPDAPSNPTFDNAANTDAGSPIPDTGNIITNNPIASSLVAIGVIFGILGIAGVFSNKPNK